MKRRNPPMVHEYVDQHGKARYYLRRPARPKVPLPGLPWSPEFMAAYEQAKADQALTSIGRSQTVSGTVNAAIIGYYQSSSFKDGLAKSTATSRRAILERFREKCGDLAVATMPRDALQRILDNLSPAAARNWKKALRGFVDHCLAHNMMKNDPLAGVKLVKMKTIGHHPWQTAECELFEAYHAVGTRARLAYELLLQAGQSKCDVVRMGRQHIRNGMMAMRRKKTGVPFNVGITPRLQEAIDAMPASNHLTLLVTAQGEPFTAAGFGNHFRDLCAAAKLPARCTSHGLRKAAATYFAEHGATDHQLMAWFGWNSISQAQVYTKEANRKLMAKSAAKLISGTGIGSPLDPVSQNEDQPIEMSRSRS
jgi:site-specific recombinase XerD